MKKGSITVFLSLVLVLLFSFLLTTLEAARLRGAAAYSSMLSELTGDSFLAAYYYPLFQNYRLFGVDMGDEAGFFSESVIKEQLEENIVYATKGLKGGLLKLQEPKVTLTSYETMLSNGDAEFLKQVRQQTVLDGLSLALETLFSEEQFVEAGVVGEIYQEQEEAIKAAATVTEELIQLMELADGICMGKNGIDFDRNGKMQVRDAFIKQLVLMEQTEVKAAYDNEEVFRVLSGSFFRADRAAARIQSSIYEVQNINNSIYRSETQIWQYYQRLQELETQWEEEKEKQEGEEEPDETVLVLLEEEMERVKNDLVAEEHYRNNLSDRRRTALSQVSEEYSNLQKKLQAVQALTREALTIVNQVEIKQKAAKISVEAYENFLFSMKSSVSGELYQMLLRELDKMKIYAGLDDRGFSVSAMKRSLNNNLLILDEIALSRFSEGNLSAALSEMKAVKEKMKGYSMEGLWFSYGDIVVAEKVSDNVTGFLAELLTTGILSLVGIAKEDQSERSLTGTELPSSGLEKNNLLLELMTCITEIHQLFRQGGIGEVLKSAGNAVFDGTALELYSMKYFHCYGKESPYTKLKYEREYLVFGDATDKTNLLSMVLHLVAIRTLFCMVMILKQPDRMAQLDMLAAGTVGFTGMPVLGAVIKYSILLLWSVEEALVETAALLQGKRVAVTGTGAVSFGDIFRMNKATIAGKAKLLPDVGAAYQDYLALLSLTRGTREKAYRAMDLIQENIRYRYNDNFRIRNLVTGLSYGTQMRLKPLFDTGFFPKKVYRMECQKEIAY